MAKFKTFRIPDDYSETDDEWVMVTMCIPNTRQWRGVVSGAIYGLTRGRNWDETTGVVKVAQVMGERIYNSMAIDCNNDFGRIATALEAINGKVPDLITLDEFLTDLQNSPILATLSNWVDLATIVDSILPNIDLKLSPVEWARFLFDVAWKRGIQGSGESIATSLRLMTLAETGETVAEGVETVDGIIDDVSDWASLLAQGGTLLAESAQAYALLRGLYQQQGADSNEELRQLLRTYNEVLLKGEAMAVNVSNNQVVNCGGGGGGCTGGSYEFVPDQTPTGTMLDEPEFTVDGTESPLDYPSGFEGYEGWKQYKCKASNAMVLGLAETMYVLYEQRQKSYDQSTYSVLVRQIKAALVGADVAMGAYSLYSYEFYTAYVAWLAEKIADYIYQKPDLTTFNIFYDLRMEMLQNYQEWVCAIYRSSDAPTIKTEISSMVAAAIGAMSYVAEVKAWASGIIDDTMSGAWLNIPFKFYENINGFSDANAIACSLCGADERVYDFSVSDQNFVSWPAYSTNPEYIQGQYWEGTNGGVGDAEIGIIAPEQLTVEDVDIYGQADNGQVTAAYVFESDSVDGPWVEVTHRDYQPIHIDEPVRFRDLGIDNKFVLFRLRRFETNPLVRIRLIHIFDEV